MHGSPPIVALHASKSLTCQAMPSMQAKHDAQAGDIGSNLDETHKSGMEPVSDRARNLTAVAEVSIRRDCAPGLCA